MRKRRPISKLLVWHFYPRIPILPAQHFLNSEKLFKLRPKIHHVDHVITEAAMDGTGRNYGWDACWYDEDWVKYCMKAYRRVSVQTAQKNLLLRNLVQIKEALEKAVLNMDS